MNQAAILALGVQTETRIIEADDTGAIFHILEGQTGAQGCALVRSDTAGIAGSPVQIRNIVGLTQAEYDAIGAPDANTKYEITDAVSPVTVVTHATGATLTNAQCYNHIHIITAAAVLQLPAGVEGMNFTVTTRGAVAGSVKAGASDFIYLDGVALDDGDKITNSSTSGDTVAFFGGSGGNLNAITDGNWTDDGA